MMPSLAIALGMFVLLMFLIVFSLMMYLNRKEFFDKDDIEEAIQPAVTAPENHASKQL